MRAFSAVALGALLVLVGCGGASSKPSSGPRGLSVLKVEWPARGRLIPVAANSLIVRVSRNYQEVARKVIARPTDGTTQTETTFDLPVGDFGIDVEAHPYGDGSGTMQARGVGTMTVTQETPGTASVSLERSIFSLTFSSGTLDTIYVGVGQKKTLTATAKSFGGSIILLSVGGATEPIEWKVANPALVKLVANGPTAEITGLAGGTTDVSVSLKASDNGRYVGSSAFIESQVASFNVVASETSKVYGSLSPSLTPSNLSDARAWNFSIWNVPAASTSTAVSLAYSGTFGAAGPSTATISAGRSSVSVSLPLANVASDTEGTVTATSVYGTARETLTLKPNRLDSLTGSASVTGGSNASGSARLQLYALEAERVSLSCSDPDVTLPASVTVAAPSRPGLGTNYGLSRSASFTIKTKPVTTAKTVTIVATRGDVTKSFDLTINP